MMTLAKHLWDRLLHDENRALIWWSSAKTAFVAFVAQIALVTGGDFAKLQTWSKWQWLGAVAATLIAAGASAKSGSGSQTP